MLWPWSDRLLLTAFVFLLCWTAIDSRAQTRFEGKGRVVAVDEVQGTVTLDHGAVPGLIPAMRTEFPVLHVEMLRKAHIGDVVGFSLVTTEESHGILTLASLEPEPRGGPEDPRAGTTLAEFPLWILLTLWATLLALVGSVGYTLSRTLREIKKGLLMAATAQKELHRDLRVVAHALEEIAETAGNSYLGGLRRLTEAVQAARGGNGRKGEMTGSRGPNLCVVRQGKTDLFQVLKERVEEPGLVRAIWDRRIRERRTIVQPVRWERRRGDRRGPPPSTWANLGFVLVPQETGRRMAEPQGSPEQR